jgi:hypothetical protein
MSRNFKNIWSEMMIIEYRVKHNYGMALWYPVSDDALLICALANTKTITDTTLQVLKQHRPDAVIYQVI